MALSAGARAAWDASQAKAVEEDEEDEVEGLAAYAVVEPSEALLGAATRPGADPGGASDPNRASGWAAPEPAVAGVLRELGRVAQHRHLPAVKDWLRVLVKVGQILPINLSGMCVFTGPASFNSISVICKPTCDSTMTCPPSRSGCACSSRWAELVG